MIQNKQKNSIKNRIEKQRPKENDCQYNDFDGDGVCEKIKNAIPDYIDGAPTVHIIRHNVAAKMVVRAVQRG